ncbi:hypothetical protein M9458_011161 [Cirrhinus mrigala]|uniref:Uncharacterized protein n=1 Tax=Cirrhinus mrigala TaxID=683832 RepID=A0ABD0R4D5_CIRMR
MRDNEGQTPLDLVTFEALREELLRCAEQGDKALDTPCLESPAHGCSAACSSPTSKSDIPTVCRTLIRLRPDELASSWGDSRVVTLAKDLRTLLNLEQYVHCHGDQTRLFVQLLDDLQAEGAALITG